uniref:HAT C-terminal dimerisation domain-containing protein n=1 Tax=Lactuca sativa TaxID=4236 RepID=A0A9R1XXF8_LACSA|nr:hypothetical protein LSAT_V11C100010100 [Lactuca sativa]
MINQILTNEKEQMEKRKQVAKKTSDKETSSCWDTFDKVMIEEDDGVKRRYGKSHWCERLLKEDVERNGTSSLLKHVDELPFKFVENEAFVEYTNTLNAKLVLPSIHTISRNVSKFYMEERTKMLQFLSNPNTAIHLTTDTWTSSCQMTTYMVRIINFREIDSHKGEDMDRELLDCIRGWGMKNLMTITLDNAATNDKTIDFLVKKLPNLYDGGKHFLVRCMTHILNLIIKDGLKYQNYHVECIQKAVRYIRLSPQRINKFKKVMKDCGLQTEKFLCDKSYERDLSRVPENYDFEVVTEMVKFFEKFKTKTELLLATSKPLKLVNQINEDMKTKYDKYWGAYNKMNDFMYFAVLLDPTTKSLMEPPLTPADIDIKACQMVREIENWMENLFMTYLKRFDNGRSSQQEASQKVIDVDDANDFFGDFLYTGGSNSNPTDNAFRTYLKENIVNYKKDFSILGWWRLNAIRFPTVAQIAKDILAIQISSVASESAFSTCGRVIIEYRTSLSTSIVEALLCTQDWVRKSTNLIIDNVDEILNDDDIALEIAQALNMLDMDDNDMGKRPMQD